MEKISKENFPGKSEGKPEEKEEKENISQKLRKRVLAATLSGLVLVGPTVAKSEKAASKQLKADETAEKLEGPSKKLTTKELVDLRLQENAFEKQASEQMIDRLNYITEKIGGWAVTQLGYLDIWNLNTRPEAKKKFIKNLNQKPETKKDIKEPVIMESMEEIGLEPELVKEVLKTLPQSWLKEVALITYLDKKNEAVVNEETGEKQELVAHHQSKGGKDSSEIYFFQGAKTKEPDRLLFLLIYECAHANNWRNRADLTLGQRISLLCETIKRAESPDRFKEPFIESIKYKDKKGEIAKKSVEYWAALCMWTLVEPENDSFPASHKKLALDYFKLTDPKFNITKAAKARNKIIADYLEKLEEKEMAEDGS